MSTAAIQPAPESTFLRLVAGLRTRDSDAWEELLARFETVLAGRVTNLLGRARIRHIVGAEDVCQSVFMRFYEQARDGKYEFERPARLLALLSTMARNEVIDLVRKYGGKGRTAGPSTMERLEKPASGPSPSSHAAGRELEGLFRASLSEEEEVLIELRSLGYSWMEVGRVLGISADATRMRAARAIDRFARTCKSSSRRGTRES